MSFFLETERLEIRPWREIDKAALVAIYSDRDVTRYLSGGRPWGMGEIDDAFERHRNNLERDGVCMGPVILKEANEIIGVAGIQRLGTTEDFEIGWVFGRSWWGRGYATEAGEAARDYVFDVLDRDRVVAIIDRENAASIRVAERLGLRFEGRRTGSELGHRMPDIVVDLYSVQRTKRGFSSLALR